MKNVSRALPAQKPPEEQWKDAISQYDSHPILALIKEGLDVNQEDQHKNTPTHYAAQNGNFPAFQCLVNNGARIARNGIGLTPAHYTIINYNDNTNGQGEYLKVLDYLLKIKCDPNCGLLQQTQKLHSPPLLEWAITTRNVLVVQLLLQYSAKYQKYMCKLNEAKADNFCQPIRDLLKLHFSPEQAFEVAIMEGDYDRVLELMKQVNVNQLLSLSNKPALYIAAQKGNEQMVRLLIDNGAEITVNSVTFHTNGNRQIIELFQKHLSPQESFNVAAAELSYNEVLALALTDKYGVQINNSVDTKGNKFVHILAEKGKPDDIKTLLALLIPNKMELNAINTQGETALHVVSRRPDADAQAALKALLDQEINCNTTDNDGETALVQAARNKEQGQWLVTLLLEYNISLLTPNQLSEFSEMPAVYKALLGGGTETDMSSLD